MLKLNKYKKQIFKSKKNFPSSTREWNNSIYTFDKYYLNNLTNKSKITMNIIRAYFNLYNKKIEKKVRRSNIHTRIRTLSSNKIFISSGTFKHTNKEVIITIFIYNRQKINYTLLLRRKFKNFLAKKLAKKLILIRYMVYKYIKEILLVSYLIEKDEKYKTILNNIYKYSLKDIFKTLVRKLFKKYKKYIFYKQILYINKSKFNYNYLSYLQNILKEIYKKTVLFDIVNLKSFYLNSDIFTESMNFKIKKKRNSLRKNLRRLLSQIEMRKVNKGSLIKFRSKNNLNLSKSTNPLNYLVLNNTQTKKEALKKTVLNLIKHKRITGVKWEAQGRLTKRNTAARSLSIIKYKGNLKNRDLFTYGKLSSVLLRGSLKSNLQYTKISSGTGIGSFGLKGWISAN